jgi:hypothetical protein
MLESGDHGGLSLSDIQKARQEIYSAMQYEKASAEALLKSTLELEEAMKRLGLEIYRDPNTGEMGLEDEVWIDESFEGDFAEKNPQ